MTESHEGRVLFERDGNVAIITLDRPSKLNAYTPAMYEELMAAFQEFNENSDYRAAIFTGSGEKAFCAGADLGRTVTALTDGAPRHAAKDITKRFFSEIYKPIITAVNGLCI